MSGTYSWFIQAKGAILCSSNLLCFSPMMLMFLVWLKQISDTSSIWLCSRYNSCKYIWEENLWDQNRLRFPIANSKCSNYLSPVSPGLSVNSESEPESLCSCSGTFRNTIFQSNCFVFSFGRIHIALEGQTEGIASLWVFVGGGCCC